jgi:heme oxygenase
MSPLMDGHCDLATYRRVLGVLYGLHAPLEHLLVAYSAGVSDMLDMRERLRVRLLRRDLLRVGMTEAEVDQLPLSAALPSVDTKGRFLGALYVREGSVLGGQALARKLDPLFGSIDLEGRRFFAGEANAGRLWRACCDAIEVAADQGHLAEMMEAAQATFDAIENWLDAAVADPRALEFRGLSSKSAFERLQ